jgi:hypothetical protein
LNCEAEEGVEKTHETAKSMMIFTGSSEVLKHGAKRTCSSHITQLVDVLDKKCFLKYQV